MEHGNSGSFMLRLAKLRAGMKKFLKENKVTHNLMAFTGFKSILIFTALIESPKSYDDLKEILQNHPYLHETVSVDTLRIYLNSLREFGCDIKKIKENGVLKFHIEKHPFTLRFSDKQIESLIKVYKAISKDIEIEEFMALMKFFNKISDYVENDELKEKLRNISPLNNIDSDVIYDLMKYTNNNNEIIVYYNSGNSGHKNITILADKLYINNGKLYLSGFNSEHQSYSSFLVSRIIKIVGVNFGEKILSVPEITVGYKYCRGADEKAELIAGEKLIKTEGNTDYIEITSRNKFEITQRILSLSSGCTVLYPEDFKMHIIRTLKKMKEVYLEKQ